MSCIVQLLCLHWRKWEGGEKRDALSALHLPCPYLLVKMIDEVTTPVIPTGWTEKRMNALSKTFAAGLHNLPAICKRSHSLHLANCLCSCSSSWSSGHAHVDFLWLSRWHLPLSNIAAMLFDLLHMDVPRCVGWDSYPSENIHFLGSCVLLALSSWWARSPVSQTTFCLIISWCFLYLMNLSPIHFKLILH